MSEKEPKYFLTIPFSKESFQQLKDTRRQMREYYTGEVLRDALVYLQWSLDQVRSGSELYVGSVIEETDEIELRKIRFEKGPVLPIKERKDHLLTVPFSRYSFQRITRLQEEMGLDSAQDLAIEAIDYLLWSREQIRSGGHLFYGSVDKPEELEKIRFSWILVGT